MADNSNSSGCLGASIVAALFVCVIVFWSCFVKVPANAVGVRTNANGGVEKKDFPPGFVLCVPFLHTVRLWDPTWTNTYQHLNIRSSDQYITTVDVSVIFRIMPDKCHEIVSKFPDYSRIEQFVNFSLSNHANEILIKLKTEDFYNADVRDKATLDLKAKIEAQLTPEGLEVKSVLLRNIVYDKNYEELLIKKQIAGQTLSLETSKTEQTKGEMETEKIEKETEAEVTKIDEGTKQEVENRIAQNMQDTNMMLQDAQLEAAKLTAKATSENRVKKSEAELLRANATAFGISALSKVYSKPGANFYFAQKALQGLKLGNIEVNSSLFNPLETEKLLKSLGLDIRASQVEKTATK